MKSFSKIISDACEKQGVSPAELARAVGQSPSWAYQVLSRSSITERVFKRCARALDLDVQVKLVPRPAAKRRTRARAEAAKELRRRPNGS
jgi:transcriptional regulator with XRE-family HTH domain